MVKVIYLALHPGFFGGDGMVDRSVGDLWLR